MSCATELAHLGMRVNALAPMARFRMSDSIYLFEGVSAETRIDDGDRAWTQDELARALLGSDQQDKSWMIAPSLHLRAGAPAREMINAFDKVARGEPVELWSPLKDQGSAPSGPSIRIGAVPPAAGFCGGMGLPVTGLG